MKNLILSVLTGLLLLSACVGNRNNGPAPVTNSVIEDIAANYNTIIENREPVTDINDYPGQEGKYTFYDLDQGVTVADSSSDVWDIAFGGTTLLANTAHGVGYRSFRQSTQRLIMPLKTVMKTVMRRGIFIPGKRQIYRNMPSYPIVMQPSSLKLQRETMLRWKYLAITKVIQM